MKKTFLNKFEFIGTLLMLIFVAVFSGIILPFIISTDKVPLIFIIISLAFSFVAIFYSLQSLFYLLLYKEIKKKRRNDKKWN